MKLLFHLASRSRPEKMFKCIENIMDKCASPDFQILITLDDNDFTCNNPVVKNRLAKYPNLKYFFAYSKNKIHAFNRDIEKADPWDIIIGTSDDIEFIASGFDDQIRQDMAANFPDTDGVLHYNDGFPHGLILTVPVMGKKYFDRFGYVYNPAYISLFCDEEAVKVADKLGKIYYSENDILKHNHPMNGAGKMDTQYRVTQSFHSIDKRTFQQREAINFGL